MFKLILANIIPLTLILIFILALYLRFISIFPSNIIIGFDQARDLSDAITIFRDQNLRIIGPTAGNNPNLHHGILYIYYLAIPLSLFSSSPVAAALWNSFFNALTVFVIFFLSKKMFNNTYSAVSSAFIVAVSFYFIQYAGWLSNPTVTLTTVPLFFLGLWMYYQKQNIGLIIASIALGLSIQFELFFIYLIPITVLIWLSLKFPLPKLKIAIFALVAFCLTTLTMIITEIKFQFGTVLGILNAGGKVSGEHADKLSQLSQFIHRAGNITALNLWPMDKTIGIYILLIIILFIVYQIFKKYQSNNSKALIFLLIYLLSPSIMLLLGYHNAPWFLIGLPPAIALASGYIIGKTNNIFLVIFFLVLIGYSNITVILENTSKGQILLEPDQGALLTDQLNAMEYTYQNSDNQPFSVNTLTNPLYINALWNYHFLWYGKNKFGFLPAWSGGDQLYPYNSMPKPNGDEKYLYLIIDQTHRIPLSYQQALISWADEQTKLVTEKVFGGIKVQKREYLKQLSD